MEFIIQGIGYIGTLCFIISYIQKSRGGIIGFTLAARMFFVVHYIFLGGYSGAVQNGVGAVSSVISMLRGKKIGNSKLAPAVIIILTLVGGVLTFDKTLGIVSLLPVGSMLLQNSALWLKNQTVIRIMLIAGLPLWFAYNFITGTLPAIVCDVMSLCSLLYSIVRFDILPKIKKKT